MSRNLSSKTVHIVLVFLLIGSVWLLTFAVLALFNIPFERVKFLVLGSCCYFLGDTIDQAFNLSRNIIARINRRQTDGKVKRKAKRDSERLALYRDWPPDLVDTFLDWDRHPRRYGYHSPAGMIHWEEGMNYKDHLADPHEGVFYVWR